MAVLDKMVAALASAVIAGITVISSRCSSIDDRFPNPPGGHGKTLWRAVIRLRCAAEKYWTIAGTGRS
jgi:hypothetical protein